MPKDRTEYQRAYYEANKAKKKANRKPQPRTESARIAEERYRKKRKLLDEIAAMPVRTIDDA
jgi:hypothetical protein